MGTIAEKLTYLNETKGKIKDSINLTGAGITNEDTFRSYAVKLRDGLLNVLNNGTIVLYNNFPKVSGTGSNISLSNTLEAPMFINKLDGDTKQLILPSEYTQVEYIESNGTQYIDTGYQITSTTDIEIKARSGGSATQVFGIEANNIGYILTAGHWRIFSTSGYRNVNYLDIHEFKTVGSKVYLKDGTLVVDCEATPVNIPNYNLYLFARNVSGTINYGTNAKIYYFRIYNNNVLVRDFIPCYRNSDNEIGMYDLVNDVFYTNQGTGSFTYGAVVPTPDSPLEIQSVEGIQNITVSDGTNSDTYEVNLEGKNLFDKDNANILNALINGTTKVITAFNSCRTFYINCKSNTTYTISKLASTRFIIGTTTNVPITSMTCNSIIQNNEASSITITTETNDNYLCVFYYNSSSDTLTEQQILDSIQIEKGSTATSYVPYREPIKMYDDDYITGTPDNWSIVRNNGSVVLNGSNEWSKQSYGGNTYISSWHQHYFDDASTNTSNITVLSDYFKTVSWDNRTQNIPNSMYMNLAEIRTRLEIRNSQWTSVSDLQTWLSTHNTEVVYKLATPTTETITDTYLISQLNALYNAKSCNGQTNISVDGQLPMILEVSALKDEI